MQTVMHITVNAINEMLLLGRQARASVHAYTQCYMVCAMWPASTMQKLAGTGTKDFNICLIEVEL